jgi:hypothetical protein
MDCIGVRQARQLVEIIPPLVDKVFHNQTEPRSQFHTISVGRLKETPKLVLGYILDRFDFIGTRVDRHIGLNNKDVVYFMFSPDPVRTSKVVYSS